MIKIKNFKFYILATLLFPLFSCEKESKYDLNENAINSHYVSKEKAIDVANTFFKKFVNNSDASRNLDVEKEIETICTVKNVDNDDVLYSINYIDGGYVLVAADDRTSPIRAFSEESSFIIDNETLPDPVIEWLEYEKEAIKIIKDNNLTQMLEIEAEWDYLDKTIQQTSPCSNSIFKKEPLLTTNWGQGAGYNNLTPLICSGVRAPTGCVPTAMAQILKYHSKPHSYFDYNQMDDHIGMFETQKLMLGVGLSVGVIYNCAETSLSGNNSSNIVNTFKGFFGYSDARLNYYVPQFVFNNINANLPVLLTGQGDSGHAWVADGTWYIVLRSPDSNGNCATLGFRFLHMNWGWGRSGVFSNAPNGWFNENNFNPSNMTYNYNRKMIYNIIP